MLAFIYDFPFNLYNDLQCFLNILTSFFLILASIEALYAQSDKLSHSDRIMFEMPLQSRLLQPIHQLASWVSTTSVTVKLCIQQHIQTMSSGQLDIRNFIKSKNNHHNSDITSQQILNTDTQGSHTSSPPHTNHIPPSTNTSQNRDNTSVGVEYRLTTL